MHPLDSPQPIADLLHLRAFELKLSPHHLASLQRPTRLKVHGGHEYEFAGLTLLTRPGPKTPRFFAKYDALEKFFALEEADISLVLHTDCYGGAVEMDDAEQGSPKSSYDVEQLDGDSDDEPLSWAPFIAEKVFS